ncbi:MAG: HlyD family type I secretion periplasmic adaptor subunit [Alphaproteobacteria bacterium]
MTMTAAKTSVLRLPGLADPEPSLRGTMMAGFIVIGLFVGGVMGWSLFARLESAVVARGAVVVDSHRKTVQHLEGGILRELLVREGDRVKAGSVLAVLDTTQADAAVGQIEAQFWSVKARLARLRAEQAGARALAFPNDLMKRAGVPAIQDVLTTQMQLFDARWRAHDGQIAVLQRRVQQLQAEMAANETQLVAVRRQIGLLHQERVSVQALVEKGYERMPRLLALERSIADLEGKAGELSGQIGSAREARSGAEFEMQRTTDQRLADIGREMQEALAMEADLNDRLRAATDIRQRREIIAPQDGVVVDLKIFTPGGVIAPGQAIMDIVPEGDALLAEARVQPADIESVRVGLPAQVWLTAFRTSMVPPIEARVVNVSADKLTDPRSGEPYFVARVSIDPESLAKLPDVVLSPGMPIDVAVVTGNRRAVDYFLAPIVDRLRRSFRER